MTSTAVEKAKIVADYQVAKNDTGSPEVQVALLTDRITYLTEHFKNILIDTKVLSNVWA